MQSERNMDLKTSSQNPKIGQPLLPLQQDPPEYTSVGFPPSEIYPSTSGQPAQQYGAPAASGQCTQGLHPGQTTQNANDSGQQVLAEKNSKTARTRKPAWAAVGVFFGLLLIVLKFMIIKNKYSKS